MHALSGWLLTPAILAAAPAWAADPIPAIAPAPSWVVSTEIPSARAERADAPFQMLLSSSQEKIRSDGLEQYVRYAAIPQTTAGLQALGNITVPWNSERTNLTLHKVSIRRDASTIDLLKANEFTVLRRESNLEKAIFDGIRTVVIPAKGLQVGDILDVAFSYTTKASAIGTKPEEVQALTSTLPLAYSERRFLVPDDVAVDWKVSSAIAPAKTVRRNGVTEYQFAQTDVAPAEIPDHTPSRFRTPLIQISGYREWSEITEQLGPLFDQARRLSPQSMLISEADEIAAASSEPTQRMLAALRLAQDQVRYVALLLGEGAYVPATADETWERKFGDCKGKTALLLGLLDRLGIEAEAVLVSVQNNDRLGEMLPSLILFDHVFVRAKIDGKSYYLDPTDYGQRTLDEVSGTPFRHGLPLRGKADLETLPELGPSAPHREATLVWDGSKGLEGEVPFEAKLVLRGSAAAEMRAKLAGATDNKKFDNELKQLMPGISNDDLEIMNKSPEAADGSFVIQFAGDAEMDWSPFEGERDTRYAFTQSTLRWDVDFDRSEGSGKDWSVFLGDSQYWERTTESVILPSGGKGYSIEAKPIEKELAGSTVARSVRKEGDRITMVADFRHLKREISAEEARAAQPLLEEIGEDFAYIVGPRVRKVRPKQD